MPAKKWTETVDPEGNATYWDTDPEWSQPVRFINNALSQAGLRYYRPIRNEENDVCDYLVSDGIDPVKAARDPAFLAVIEEIMEAKDEAIMKWLRPKARRMLFERAIRTLQGRHNAEVLETRLDAGGNIDVVVSLVIKGKRFDLTLFTN